MSSEKFTLLVVDDNEDNRDMLSRRLIRKGFEVLTADGGEAALALVQQKPIDLILLDIMMPGISGIDVLRELRKEHSSDDLPILMVTAKSESDDIVEALGLEANDYITKPIDFPVALARVEVHLRKKQPKTAKPAPHKTPQPYAGMVLQNKYRLDSKIGAGGFGVVFRATHIELRRPVAVKILLTNFLSGAQAITRFRAEGITTSKVQHPNAVSVSDFDVTDDGLAYLVMELLEGRSLEAELEAKVPFSLSRGAEIIASICDALTVAHQNRIVHRDIKPSNIFLHQGTTGEVAKLLDFGLAKFAAEDLLQGQKTADGHVLGTMSYIAPERLKNHPYDGAVDIYGLGCILYEMCCRRLPFVSNEAEPIALALMHLNEQPIMPRKLNESIPVELESLIMKTLHKAPSLRPSAKELAQKLRALSNPTLYALSNLSTKLPESSRAFAHTAVISASSLEMDVALLDTQEPSDSETCDLVLDLDAEVIVLEDTEKKASR